MTGSMEGRFRGRGTIVAIILVGLLLIPLSRAPQWLGGQTFPDGDESVVGLMAKHMAEGRGLPIFA